MYKCREIIHTVNIEKLYSLGLENFGRNDVGTEV